MEQIARPARQQRRLSPERRGEIIISLCRRAPLSVKDLSVLLDRSEAYIGDAIRPLVTAGDLTFLYPDQPRHPRQKYMAAPEIDVDLTPVEEVPVAEPTQAYLAPPARPEPRRREDAPFRAPPAHRLPANLSQRPPDEPPRYPNAAVNLGFAVLVGVILGWTGAPFWWAIALVAGLALSFWHKLAGTTQYNQFAGLQTLPGGILFLVLKSAVTFGEIALVFLVTRALAGG